MVILAPGVAHGAGRAAREGEGGAVRGLDFALNDIGLAVFTTLAPAATVAYMALACLVLLGRLGQRERRCLESWLILPLAIATVGLIASAAHLGTPGNALYVFANVGVSPLSTEVLCAVTFLGISGLYWLACIYFERMRVLRSAWLCVSIMAGGVFLWGTTQAYDFPTVITWVTSFSHLNLSLAGVAGSAPLALLVLVCAGQQNRRGLAYALLGVSAVATVLSCISMAAQYCDLGEMRNAFGPASDLVPFYPVAIALFAIGCLGACAIALFALRRYWSLGETPTFHMDTPAERRAARLLICASVVALLGIFGVRFSFYCFHMTAGMI